MLGVAANGSVDAFDRKYRTAAGTVVGLGLGMVIGGLLMIATGRTRVGIVRHFVLFVIELGTRRVDMLGITRDPCEAWMRIVGRGATDAVDGCLRHMRYLLHDRDPLFCRSFRELLAGRGVKCVRLPARSPNLNAYAERFIGSIRRECLDRVTPLGEQHLRRIVAQHVRHYDTERNHQGIGNRLIAPTIAANGGGTIRCRERLGGMLRFHHREAA